MPEKTKKEKKPAKPAQAKILIIVESPTKTKSLSKFLGSEYRIESSKGHLIDLPKSSMGIDIEHNFEPRYITIRGKGKTLAELKKAAKNVGQVLLATDPDREGEAISWHLARILSEVNGNIRRIEFNEITREAVISAIEHPRDINLLLVNSQQARRLLDRLVGYSISPILQSKFGSRRFSAGRVQSAALKILSERENEIENFKPREYWEIEGSWKKPGGRKKDQEVMFKLVQIAGEKVNIGERALAEQIEAECQKAAFAVSLRKKSDRSSRPQPPYITSKLQQEASTRLGFRAQKTMSVAQSLYEGVEISHEQQVGLITYMRTDSTRISEAGLAMARSYIAKNFPPEYLPANAIQYASQKQAQDAHEAIRPTDVSRTPEALQPFLSRDQFKLYQLIWSRFVASQMAPALDELVTIEVVSSDKKYLFRYSASIQKFAGYRAVFASEEKSGYVPDFNEGEKVELSEFAKTQKFTQPPARFTEASLIKIMEESGIGRPATYVPTIATLDKRAYIERKGRQLKPTILGRVVNEMIVKHFPDIVDLSFTAGMEEKLDEVGQGNINWQNMLQEFYTPFAHDLEKAAVEMENQDHLVRIPIGKDCPQCGQPLMKKLGKNGYFIGCSNFAGGCRYTESIPLGKCPLCSGKVIRKASKKGRAFFGCENYSHTGCQFTMLDPPASRECPRCGSIMSQKVRKSGITLTCQNSSCNMVLEEKNDESQDSA